MLGALLLHAAHDALGDDVAGRELGQLVLARHEADAVGVDEVGALAAYRLGDQRLLALGVGARGRAPWGGTGRTRGRETSAPGAQRERHAVAGGDGRVGGGREDLAHAAGGEDHGGGVDGADAVVLALAHDVQGDAGRAAVGVREQVEDEGVLDRARCPARVTASTRAREISAPVASPPAWAMRRRWWPPSRVSSSSPSGRLVEVGAGLDQPAYGVRALGDEEPYGLLVAQARAGDQGVVQVLLGGVALAEGRGDAALGPAGGAVVEAGLGDDDRREAGRRRSAARR